MKFKYKVIENKWLSREVKLDDQTYNHRFGWGNGYVGVTRESFLYGLHYNDIEIVTHYGLTFSGNFEDEGDYWFFGFDTLHHGDTLENCTKEYVIDEAMRLLKRFENQEYSLNDTENVLKKKMELIKNILSSDFKG